MERERQHSHLRVTRFNDVPHTIQSEMAKYLDTNANANWAALAEYLGFSPLDINVIDYRGGRTNDHSPTLYFFREYCLPKAVHVLDVVQGLDEIKNLACLTVLLSWLETQREPSPSSSHHIEDSGFNSPASRPEVLVNDGELWRQVERIGTDNPVMNIPLTYENDHRHLPRPNPPEIDQQQYDSYTVTDNCDVGLDLRRAPRDELAGETSRTMPAARVSEPVNLETTHNVGTDAPVLRVSPCTTSAIPQDKTDIVAKWCQDQRAYMQSNFENGTSVKYRESKEKPPLHGKNVNRFTDPLSQRDIKKLRELSLQPTTMPMRATISDVQNTEFVQDARHVRVYLTYTYDNKRHMANVLNLCKCLKANSFTVGLDARESHLLRETEVTHWHDMRYGKADAILVLVSPLYHRVATGKTSRKDNPEGMLHAQHILQRMYSQHIGSCANPKKIVSVVMPGASKSHIPDWLRKSSTHFTWPKNYQDLMFYLIQPTEVIAEFVAKQERSA